MEKNWKYKNRPLAKISSLLKVLSVNAEQLDFIIKNKEAFYIQNKPKTGSKRITYKVLEPLLSVHQRIHDHILAKVILPDYIVGGVKSKSYITNCEIHSRKKTILSEDIKNFFPSITSEVVDSVLCQNLNFSPYVSSILAELVTYNGGLVQGSVVSTSISNIVFLDKERVIKDTFDSMNIEYTRFVDDITLSSDLFLTKEQITMCKMLIYGMIKSKNLIVNRKKSKIMHAYSSQIVHKVKVNNGLTPSEKRIKNLRLELYNFSKSIDESMDVMLILKKFRRIKGLINTIKQQGSSKYLDYSNALISSVAKIDEYSARKAIRSLRKVKSIKKLRILKGHLKPLVYINKKMEVIIDSEFNAMKNKLMKTKLFGLKNLNT